MAPWEAPCSAWVKGRKSILLVELKFGFAKPSLIEDRRKALTMGSFSATSSTAQDCVRPGIFENEDWLWVTL
eukprot:CAMPEP_0181485752 /NCGR_PEP_ID=MMETSP1110-20121109/46745_1 /TAXON_ID=174948 /ORGANISM="Symbiodinium sp., Strain CCMP421" /LENGTH=71 /DNA_ID=CAMNT_0023611797 /DNA_START=286 /DNA_END=501 /DNA_ORIENTATION=-